MKSLLLALICLIGFCQGNAQIFIGSAEYGSMLTMGNNYHSMGPTISLGFGLVVSDDSASISLQDNYTQLLPMSGTDILGMNQIHVLLKSATSKLYVIGGGGIAIISAFETSVYPSYTAGFGFPFFSDHVAIEATYNYVGKVEQQNRTPEFSMFNLSVVLNSGIFTNSK